VRQLKGYNGWHFILTICFVCLMFNDASAEGSWSVPVTISTNNADVPNLAMNAGGDGVVIWTDRMHDRIQAATFSLEKGEWSTSATLSPRLFYTASHPAVAVNAQGQAVAIWQHLWQDSVNPLFCRPLSDIHAVKSVIGSGTWSQGSMLSALGPSETPKVVINDSGRSIAIWPNESLQSALQTSEGDDWSSPITVSALTIACNPQIVLDGADNAIAVWELLDSDKKKQIYAAILKAGGMRWSDSVQLSGVGNASVPQVAAGPGGFAVAVWQLEQVIQAAILSNNSWSSASTLSLQGEQVSAPQIAVDSLGNAAAVWQNDSRGGVIQLSTLTGGSGAWSAPIDLSAAGASAPQVVFDPNGNAAVVWTNGKAEISTCLAAEGVWSKPYAVSPPLETVIAPQVGVDVNSNILVVWNNSTLKGTVQAAAGVISSALTPVQPVEIPTPKDDLTDGSGSLQPPVVDSPPIPQPAPAPVINPPATPSPAVTAPAPPTNLRGSVFKNRHSSQADRIVQLRWDPSPDPSVVGYNIYRDSKLIANVPLASSSGYDDHMRRKWVSHVYLVVSVNAAGIESPYITVTLP